MCRSILTPPADREASVTALVAKIQRVGASSYISTMRTSCMQEERTRGLPHMSAVLLTSRGDLARNSGSCASPMSEPTPRTRMQPSATTQLCDGSTMLSSPPRLMGAASYEQAAQRSSVSSVSAFQEPLARSPSTRLTATWSRQKPLAVDTSVVAVLTTDTALVVRQVGLSSAIPADSLKALLRSLADISASLAEVTSVVAAATSTSTSSTASSTQQVLQGGLPLNVDSGRKSSTSSFLSGVVTSELTSPSGNSATGATRRHRRHRNTSRSASSSDGSVRAATTQSQQDLVLLQQRDVLIWQMQQLVFERDDKILQMQQHLDYASEVAASSRAASLLAQVSS